MVNIVIVSHSHLLAEGLKQMASEMCADAVKILSAGGLDESTLGTNAEKILKAIQEAYTDDGVIVFFDLGGALFNAQMAIEMLPVEQRDKVRICGAPVVEGTLVAAVESSLGKTLDEVQSAAEACRLTKKC